MTSEAKYLTDQNKSSPWLIAFRVLFTLAVAGTIVFIFSNSNQIGSVSGLRSQQVTALFNGLMGRLGIGFTFSELLVRKLGHLAEFMLLGFWLMLTLRIYTRHLLAHISWPLLGGLLVAVGDEFLQKFVPGRSSDVTDVLIDFAGVVCGLVAALILMLLVRGIISIVKGRKRKID